MAQNEGRLGNNMKKRITREEEKEMVWQWTDTVMGEKCGRVEVVKGHLLLKSTHEIESLRMCTGKGPWRNMPAPRLGNYP